MRTPRHPLATAFLLALIPTQLQAQTKGDPMSATAQVATLNETAIHRLYDECLNQNRLDLLPELVSANVIDHTYAGEKTGLAAFEQGIQATRRMFSGQRFTLDGVVANGDRGAAHWTMTAINSGPIAGIPASGKPITQHGVVFFRFEEGKIAEVWLQVDRLGIFQQIGAAVPGSPQPSSAH